MILRMGVANNINLCTHLFNILSLSSVVLPSMALPWVNCSRIYMRRGLSGSSVALAGGDLVADVSPNSPISFLSKCCGKKCVWSWAFTGDRFAEPVVSLHKLRNAIASFHRNSSSNTILYSWFATYSLRLPFSLSSLRSKMWSNCSGLESIITVYTSSMTSAGTAKRSS